MADFPALGRVTALCAIADIQASYILRDAGLAPADPKDGCPRAGGLQQLYRCG